MGLDITVVMADWEHLARIPAAARLDALIDAVCPDYCCDPCEEADRTVPGGWVWQRRTPWCAEYRFFGTTGTYAWHFRLAEAWEDLRPSASPALREALDRFLGGLFWHGPDQQAAAEPDDGPRPAPGFPGDPAPWRPEVLALGSPDEVAALTRAWETAAPRLEELREPFAASAGRRPAWFATFDVAGALLREWGDVATGAGERGWGLIGLPY
ncbi:hypothetical protein ABZW32_25355 [Streptomyces sp. NPDC004667]|uniref:hypothetical protein n=1 Tax=Streptomyces sp. NPDC004667 TaxID=3154285 RepID=UPI0033BDEA13